MSEEKMRQIDRLANLGTLSAGVAHEIKNSLTAVKTFIDLLLQKAEDREMAEVVARELKRIDLLAGQILRFSVPKPPSYETVRVHEALDHCLRLLQHQIGEKAISLATDFRANPDAVEGDAAQLQQVCMNLLLNALEAMSAGGTLAVSTALAEEKTGRCVRVEVRDTGIGISPENLSQVFRPFFTTKKNGTGLGLAISQRIIHAHRGSIEVGSEFAKGSTFTVRLPASRHGKAHDKQGNRR
ncbi:MAG: hypothetical protein KGJ88_06360 [Verrucomicrobiota bacterium]|nr:hypothetical protein [Verrucomicrobiota bacterium]